MSAKYCNTFQKTVKSQKCRKTTTHKNVDKAAAIELLHERRWQKRHFENKTTLLGKSKAAHY